MGIKPGLERETSPSGEELIANYNWKAENVVKSIDGKLKVWLDARLIHFMD